ncbi:MAG: oligoribonuclease [Polyangiaceae bacterium]|nr:oligoribonuclease [Polyangiaceae bacterium]
MTTSDRLVWIDLEMTGLDPRVDHILEMATLITDATLEVVATGPEIVIHQTEAVLGGMNDWSREHHAASGLLDRVRGSPISVAAAEARTLDFVRAHCEVGTAPLAGNSIHMDRFFLKFHMPSLEGFLHYRNVDVTTVKELARRWAPGVLEASPRKADGHRALEDIRESIAELAHYRTHLFRLPGTS